MAGNTETPLSNLPFFKILSLYSHFFLFYLLIILLRRENLRSSSADPIHGVLYGVTGFESETKKLNCNP